MRSLSRVVLTLHYRQYCMQACAACMTSDLEAWCAQCGAWRRLVAESEAAAKTCLQCQVLLKPSRYLCQSCGDVYAVCECRDEPCKTDTTTVVGGRDGGEGETCRYPPCRSCGNPREVRRAEHAFKPYMCLSCRQTQGVQICHMCLVEKKQDDYDKKKWNHMMSDGHTAVCKDCAAKLECSACKEKHAPDQLKSFSKGKVRLCGKCEGNGYGPRALETHQCAHCSFVGGAGKFDKKSFENAAQRGSPKKCLQCSAEKPWNPRAHMAERTSPDLGHLYNAPAVSPFSAQSVPSRCQETGDCKQQ